MDRSYVQQYGSLEKHHWWFAVRRKILLQLLRSHLSTANAGKLRVLNVGAAAGDSSHWLSVFGPVISLENDPLFLSYLREQQIDVVHASVTRMPFEDDRFDLVCALDVIEHVSDHEKAVRELFRVCRPGGRICMTVPAFPSLWGEHDVVNGHQRRYTKESLLKLVNGRPGKLLYTTYFNTILFLPIYVFRKIQRLRTKKKARPENDFKVLRGSRGMNWLLGKIFSIELPLLRFARLPYGVSLFLLCEKSATEEQAARGV